MKDGKFISDDGIIKVTPNEGDKKALKNYDGKDVFLGIRSERFLSGKTEESFEGIIDVIEVLGKEENFICKA